MKTASNHKCCSVRQRTLDKDIMKLIYPSLSQEVFDTLSPRLKFCTKMYIYSKKYKQNMIKKFKMIIVVISQHLKIILKTQIAMTLKY